MNGHNELQFFYFRTLDGETLVAARHIQQIQPSGLLELASGAELRNRHSFAAWRRAIEIAADRGGPIIDLIGIEEELASKRRQVLEAE